MKKIKKIKKICKFTACALYRLYTFHFCRSKRKIETNMFRIIAYYNEKNRYMKEKEYTLIFHAWKRILKIGSLYEILDFLASYEKKIGEEGYLTVNVAEALMSKIKKEDFSYQLVLFLALLDWFLEFRNISISKLRINPDTFFALNQKFFDTIVDNLPMYQGKIYFDFCKNDISTKDIVRRLIQKFSYLENSQSSNAQELKDYVIAIIGEEKEIIMKNNSLIKDFPNILGRQEVLSAGENILKQDTFNLDGYREVISQQEDFLSRYRQYITLIDMIKTSDISLCTDKFLRENALQEIFEKNFDKFLNSIRVESSLNKLIVVVETKKQIIFEGEIISEYLWCLFNHLIKSRDDDQIKRIINVLDDSLSYLFSFKYKVFLEFIQQIVYHWLNGKSMSDALLIPTILEKFSKHPVVLKHKNKK